MSTLNNKRLVWLDLLRVLGAMAVVMVHVDHDVLRKINHSSGILSEYVISQLISGCLFWCVPIFVLVSGYSILKESNKSYSNELLNRGKRVIYPLLAWGVFYTGIDFVYSIQRQITSVSDITYNGVIDSLLPIVDKWLSGHPPYHLWYLAMTFFLYVFAPYLRVLLWNMEKSNNYRLVILFFLMSVGSVTVSYFDSILYNGQVLDYHQRLLPKFLLFVGYFYMGGVLRRFPMNISNRILIPTLLGLFTLSSLGRIYNIGALCQYSSIDVVLESIIIFVLVQKIKFSPNKLLVKLSSLTLGIYLIHGFVINVFNLLFGDLQNEIHVLIYVPLLSVAVFLASALCVWGISSIGFLKKYVV